MKSIPFLILSMFLSTIALGQIPSVKRPGKENKMPRPTIKEDLQYPAYVAADKMNVFYIGVKNSLSVSIAGVSSDDLQVSGSGSGIQLKQAGEGKYEVTVTTPGTVAIAVSVGSRLVSSYPFQVKRMPAPIARLGNSTGGGMSTREFKAQGGVGAYLDNFDFEASCTITGFNLVHVARTSNGFAPPVSIANAGARFSSEAKKLIVSAKPGDIYYFDNVRAQCPGDVTSREINTMVFNIR